jgi:hypothetical protein
MLSGYHADPKLDLAKDERWNKAGWVFLGGAVLCMVYDLSGLPFGLEVFQAWFATSLCYGASVYVKRRNHFNELWLWKAVSVTVPLHIAYLVLLFWSDKAFPSVMTKATAFVPILAIAYAIESILFDWVVDRFEPPSAEQVSGPISLE